jgi:tetrahydromethanopterin S-methyltransferase subunit F
VVETDSYVGASIVDINEEHHINFFKDFAYKIQLLKRDLRLFLGLEVHDFLLPLEYERDK